MRRSRHRYRADPFTDLLFNALLGFTFLFLISVLFVNPEARRGTANLKAEYMITLTWPETLSDDLDIWVEDPHGEVVSYLDRDAGWLHLDRDDRGTLNDTIEIDGRKVVHPINQEVVTIRGIVAGQYVVNVYYFDRRSGEPVPASVQIDRINPQLRTVFFGRVTLDAVDQELTVLRFNLNDDGDFHGVSNTPRRLTPYRLEY